LGIDFGDRKIGLALSDILKITAQPLMSYRRKNNKEDAAFFKQVVKENDVSEIIVGMPLRMDGSHGTRAEKTQEFARWLEGILNIPIHFWDERLTTKQANQILSRRKINPKNKRALEDQVSAMIILSTYLESKGEESGVDQND
jgi:putative Holliday junction resolvase